MGWIWRHISLSLRLGWKDAWQTLGQRVVISVLAVVLTGGLVYLATGKPGTALLGAVAYPILLVAACLVYSVGRLCGYNRLWQPESKPAPDNMGISAQLRAKGHPMLTPLPYGAEVRCVVRDPAGRETEEYDIRFFRGLCYFTYPNLGGQSAGPLVSGNYWLSWQWRNPRKSKWHLYDGHRVVVPVLRADL